MKTTNEAHIRVIDNGIFLTIARRLAREARKVSYWTPIERAFRTVKDCIGDGFDDVERVYNPWQDKDDVDCWCFPDIGFSWFQSELLSQGRIVWGGRDSEELEIYRGKFLDGLKTTDLPMPPHQRVVGMTNLRALLADKKDCYIKISQFRGDWETLHWRDWEQDEVELAARSCNLGPWKEHMTFYVFDKIETKIEDGCDAYCIDGKFPSLVIHGMEAKDKAYLGTFQKFSDLPKEVRCVNDAFGPILEGYGCRGFFSTEVRITEEDQSYFIDPTIRAGSPPSQVMCEMIGNLGDIIWRGANGELVDPEPAHKFGVQAILCVCGSRANWRTVQVPDDLDQWIKCGFCSRMDGVLAFPPDPEMHRGEVGWLVGVGDSAREAIEHLKDNASKLPDGLHCEYHSIADLLNEVEAAEKAGMEFTEQPMPEPEVVVTK